MPKYLVQYKLNPSKQLDDPKVSYEAMKTAMVGADALAEAGIIKHHWSMAPGAGIIIARATYR